MNDLVAALKDAPGGAFDVEAFAGGGYTLSWYQSSGTTYLVPRLRVADRRCEP